MNRTNLHLYPSTFKFESRILKETKSIIKFNLASRIVILSAGDKGQLVDEEITSQILVHRIIPWKSNTGPSILKALFYLEFYLRAFFFGLQLKVDVINCHSLMMLPISVALKWIKRARLIYDPHELETERLGLKGKAQRVSRFVERSLISSCDATIVVSKSILDWYVSAYQLENIFMIRNASPYFNTSPSTLLRDRVGIPDGQLIFLYQGLVNEGRSIEIYLKTFSSISHHHLVIMGYGPLEDMVKDHAKKFANIHFVPAVKPADVLNYTQGADVGLSLIENCCLSYYFSLPNKLFEYIMAEIPMVVSNFPDMANIVNANAIGWSVDVSEQGLAEVIRGVTGAAILERKEQLKRVKSEIAWENEEKKLVEVFSRLNLKEG